MTPCLARFGDAIEPRRRDVIRLAIGATVSWAGTAAGQGNERVRVIGLLFSLPLNDRLVTGESDQSRVPGLKERLEQLGWIEGRNIRFEIRSTYGGQAARDKAVKDLIGASPDLIITTSTPDTIAVQAATRTIPIIFTTAADPIGSGLVESLARPGGNLTGFTNGNAEIGAKWLELLKELDPRIVRAGVLFNPKSVPRGGSFYLDPILSAAPLLGVSVTPAHLADATDIDAIIGSFASRPAGGLILPPDSFTVGHRQAIVAAAARHGVPAIYSLVYFMAAGGLMSYGAGLEVRSAEYVNLILRGAKPAELPVQSPRKYELQINRKVAAALGLTLSPVLLARADRIIE